MSHEAGGFTVIPPRKKGGSGDSGEAAFTFENGHSQTEDLDAGDSRSAR